MSQLTIIIVAYNSAEIISKCLRGFYGDFPVIVVDNASSDNIGEIVGGFDGVQVLVQPYNLGYGRGANVGLCAVKTPYALIINPDIEVSAAEISKLLDGARKVEGLALAAPNTGFRKIAPYEIHEDYELVEWASGAATLFDMSALTEIGLFDENIFLFYEDTDMCRRIRQADKKIVFFPDINFAHEMGTSSTPSEKVTLLKYTHMEWSKFYYLKKHGDFVQIPIDFLKGFFIYPAKWLYFTLKKKRSKQLKYEGKIRGMFAYFCSLDAIGKDGKQQLMNTGK